jgi:DNA-binding LacI/PurR family transcriptional regulator
VLFALRRPFEVELVEHMFPVVAAAGYHLLLGATTDGRSQTAVVDELLGYRCEGLIVVGPDRSGESLQPIVGEVPVVAIGRGVSPGVVDVIGNDDALGARQAVDHLADLGHRAIAFVGGGQNPGADNREAGYRAAMTRRNLAAEIRVVPGGYTEAEGAKAAQALLGEGLPTAVITSNDLSAVGLLDTMLRAGMQVPADLSVVGYDDSRVAWLPGIDLTSVRQDAARMAELAVQAVVDLLDGSPRPPRVVALAPRLIVRGTTASPRA